MTTDEPSPEAYKNVQEYIDLVWHDEKLREYSSYSVWQESILEIVQTVWLDAQFSAKTFNPPSNKPLSHEQA